MIWYLAIPGQFLIEGVPNARPTLTVGDNILTTGRAVNGLGTWEPMTFRPTYTDPITDIHENSATLVGYDNGKLLEVWTIVGAIYFSAQAPKDYSIAIATAGYSRVAGDVLTGVVNLVANPGGLVRSVSSLAGTVSIMADPTYKVSSPASLFGGANQTANGTIL